VALRSSLLYVCGESRIHDSPSFQILYPRHPLLRIPHHFSEQVGEAGTAQLGGARAVEVPVVDCFAVCGGAETGGRLGELGDALELGGGLLLEGGGGLGGRRCRCHCGGGIGRRGVLLGWKMGGRGKSVFRLMVFDWSFLRWSRILRVYDST